MTRCVMNKRMSSRAVIDTARLSASDVPASSGAGVTVPVTAVGLSQFPRRAFWSVLLSRRGHRRCACRLPGQYASNLDGKRLC